MDPIRRYDADFVPPSFGCVNLGATCYFNALFQSIISCPAFTKVLIEHRDMAEYKSNPVVRDMLAMYDIAFDRNLDPAQQAIMLRNFAPTIWRSVFDKASLRQDNVKFTNGQECAREGFHLFLEALDGLHDIQNLFLHRYQTLIFCADCDDWVVNTECEYTMFEVQPSLSSPQNPMFRNVDPNYGKKRPLDQFLKKQNSCTDEFFKCPRCNKADIKFQTTRLVMIPEILVVLAKKYDGGMRKSHEITDFPEMMAFDGKKTDDAKADDEPIPMIYRAVSQIEHMGSMAGGHYNCHALRQGNEWYCLDDTHVSGGRFGPTPNTYLVFYHIQ